jgi:hypothetical protein
MTFDNFSIKNIDKVTKKILDPVLNSLIKGDSSPFFEKFEPNYKTSMFIMKTFKSAFLMKSKDFQKDAENLSRDIFFHLFKEFDNKHFRDNLYIWNIGSNLSDPVFHVYGSLFSIINAKAGDMIKDFKSTPIHFNNFIDLERDSDIADRYDEFLKILERAKTKVIDNKQQKLPAVRALKTIKNINLTNFKFF